MSKYKFYTAYKQRKELQQYGANALTLFAIQLLYDIDDIISIATDAIVDGPDDGGIDFIHIDREQKLVIIAQTYENEKQTKEAAPLTKAKYLSSGLSILIKNPIEEVPERLQPSARQLREALKNKEIQRFHILYIHNLPGSVNAEKELKTAELLAKSLLEKYSVEEIQGIEVCAEYLEKRHKSLTVTIYIEDQFEIPISGGFMMEEDNWSAFVTSIPAIWLYQQFEKYSQTLFSANVRDYLGRRTDKSINSSIQETAKNDPGHFWVFNNGITALVHSFKVDKNSKLLTIKGLSIVNGAQTTGAIGNLDSPPDKKAMIQARFVKSTNKNTVLNIKRYNNSQNKVEASDFRSNDPTQERLTKEFESIAGIQYSPRRGGVEDIVKRGQNTLNSVLAGQVLAAFHGNPDIAYHKKTKIWEEDMLYSKYFNSDISGKHVFFVYSLFEAIKNKKLQIHQENKSKKLKSTEEDKSIFFQTRGSTFLLLAAIASSLEIFLDTAIPNKFRLEFTKNVSFDEAVKLWEPIVGVGCSFVKQLQEGFSEGAVREKEAKEAIKKFVNLIDATKSHNEELYFEFSKKVRQK